MKYEMFIGKFINTLKTTKHSSYNKLSHILFLTSFANTWPFLENSTERPFGSF